MLLAGPYHPAFRQLVESELLFDLACRLAGDLPRGSRVELQVAPGRTSDLVGQRRGNLVRLSQELGIEVTKVREDAALTPACLLMTWSGGRRSGSLDDLTDESPPADFSSETYLVTPSR